MRMAMKKTTKDKIGKDVYIYVCMATMAPNRMTCIVEREN